MPPRRTQEERSEETRGRLLEATIASLIDVGYTRTTTTEVARRAGLSRGAQLHHFPTKAELVVAAIGHLARSRTDELVAQVNALPKDPEDWIDAAIDLLWSTFRGPLFYAALELWVAARTDGELAKHLLPAERQLGREIMEHVVAVLPAEIRANPGATALIGPMLHFMRGLALRRLLTDDDPAYERQQLDAVKAQARLAFQAVVSPTT